MTLDPVQSDFHEQHRLYEDCIDYEHIRKKWVQLLDV